MLFLLGVYSSWLGWISVWGADIVFLPDLSLAYHTPFKYVPLDLSIFASMMVPICTGFISHEEAFMVQFIMLWHQFFSIFLIPKSCSPGSLILLHNIDKHKLYHHQHHLFLKANVDSAKEKMKLSHLICECTKIAQTDYKIRHEESGKISTLVIMQKI